MAAAAASERVIVEMRFFIVVLFSRFPEYMFSGAASRRSMTRLLKNYVLL